MRLAEQTWRLDSGNFSAAYRSMARGVEAEDTIPRRLVASHALTDQEQKREQPFSANRRPRQVHVFLVPTTAFRYPADFV